MFILHNKSVTLFILIYINDIIVTGSNQDLINAFIKTLGSHFLVKDPGPLQFFLGIKVTCTATSIFLSQSKFIYDLLERVNMHLSK